MRKYNPATDYPIILEASRKAGEPRIADAALALQAAGIHWPGLQDSRGRMTPEQEQMDREIYNAWVELGYTH